MEAMKIHPNTEVVLDAWKRLADGRLAHGASTADDAALVGSLFVLNHIDERDFPFRRCGVALERLFGRQLEDYNFLSIWCEGDRRLVAAGLGLARRDHGPVLIRARGETLVGKRIDLEFALAPLFRENDASIRFLGLCQPLTPEDVLDGRPLRRLQALAIYPPATPKEATIRIVTSN
jgi:hypothetical protein